MRKLLPILLFFITVMVAAQIPAYYNDVNLNLNGASLKNELATKISSTHTNFLSYTPGVWNTLKVSDLDPNNSSNVILIYGYNDNDGNHVTDRTRSKNANGGNAGTQWNREHVYPKSLANPNLGTSGPGADAHNLRPSDITFNSQRSNKKFANGSGNSGNSSGGWYPGNEWKGDVARMIMYMYLRYGNQCLPKNVGISSTIASDTNMVQLFLEWNAEDPVSNFEKQRNTSLAGVQGNRNPFIDNPAFATKIWGGPQAEDLFGNGNSNDTQAPSIPSNVTASNITQNSVNLSWNSSSDNVAVTKYNIYRNSTLLGSSTNTSTSISGLNPNTSYSFIVRALDAAGNISGNSNTLSITTAFDGSTSGGSELFISEYIEGSSNNKAIEIANLTGRTINLSSYSLRKTINGNNSFGSTYNLSGQLADGNVLVIANSNASTTIKNKADITTSSSILTFNGNDAIALFKSNTLLDVVGNPSSSSNIIQNVTLQRKTSIKKPNTSYTSSEWNQLNSNNSDDLGNINGGGSSPSPISYCDSKGNNANFEYIDNVIIGGVSNTSSNNNGYGDFTNLTANLSFGSNTIVVSAGFSGSSYTEYWKVWIDFNKNGSFETNEEVVSGSSSSSGNLSSTFTVPSTSLSGNTRMRVSMKYNSSQTSCESFAYGEVEDYTVNIGTSSKLFNSETNSVNIDGKLGNEPAIFNTTTYPNPVKDFLNISLHDNRMASYKVINLIGKTILKGTIEKIIDVNNLKDGIYILEINDGQRTLIKKIVKE